MIPDYNLDEPVPRYIEILESEEEYDRILQDEEDRAMEEQE
jgi:hypothetical protein